MNQVEVDKVTAIARNVREFCAQTVFTREGELLRSEGHCFTAAHVLAHALSTGIPSDQWVAVEGIYANQSVRELAESGGLQTWSQLEDAGQTHGWAIRQGASTLVVDVTGDQFGLGEVLVMEGAQATKNGWYPRFVPDRSPPDNLQVLLESWNAWIARVVPVTA